MRGPPTPAKGRPSRTHGIHATDNEEQCASQYTHTHTFTHIHAHTAASAPADRSIITRPGIQRRVWNQRGYKYETHVHEDVIANHIVLDS